MNQVVIQKKKSSDQIAKERVICIIGGCGEVQKSRGLCVHHYAIARGRVKSGRETWKSFEVLGVALPPSSGPTGVRVDQFDAAVAKARVGGK